MLLLLPFYNAMQYWAKKFMYWLLDVLIGVLNEIPVPDFFSQASVSGLPSQVAFFLGPLNVGTGVSIILTAYVIRFTIRRIPVIG